MRRDYHQAGPSLTDDGCDAATMSRPLFIIGPSRVGKSTAARYVAGRLDRVAHHDLDLDVKPFRQPGVNPVITAQDWTVLHPILRAYESGIAELAIVDIGAGTQNMVEHGHREILDWLARPQSFVVLLTAEPTFAWNRWIDGRPDMADEGFDRFLQQEFTGRRELYWLADRTIDVADRVADEVGDELLGIATQLLARSR
jgi:shikimate kinase